MRSKLPPILIAAGGSVRPVPVTESCIWRDVEVFWNIEEYLPDIYKEQKEDLLFEQAAYKISRACRKYGIHTAVSYTHLTLPTT